MPDVPRREDGRYYAVTIPLPVNGVQPRYIEFSPIPHATVPDEYIGLQIDVERTLTVLNVLFPPQVQGRVIPARLRRNADKFSEYYLKLADIALTSLGQDQPRLGRMALNGLQDEIVAREAAHVKNTYIRRLGFWAFGFAVPTVIFYLVCRYSEAHTLLNRFREFISLLAGCYLGTWLSFAIRRQQLTFWDLARLEEDLLDPPFRLLFVSGLTLVIGLFFSTRMVVFNIGGFNTGFMHSGSLAVLIGALCGIGEIGLTGAVARRTSDFIAAIGASAVSNPAPSNPAPPAPAPPHAPVIGGTVADPIAPTVAARQPGTARATGAIHQPGTAGATGAIHQAGATERTGPTGS
ncbi:MAG TPA: hypothetical protein VHY35_21495 [Stellaceae bacterium]|jgi:hypothetical protein|nr:hypothetical protein [Stellaceae bacterium]